MIRKVSKGKPMAIAAQEWNEIADAVNGMRKANSELNGKYGGYAVLAYTSGSNEYRHIGECVNLNMDGATAPFKFSLGEEPILTTLNAVRSGSEIGICLDEMEPRSVGRVMLRGFTLAKLSQLPTNDNWKYAVPDGLGTLRPTFVETNIVIHYTETVDDEYIALVELQDYKEQKEPYPFETRWEFDRDYKEILRNYGGTINSYSPNVHSGASGSVSMAYEDMTGNEKIYLKFEWSNRGYFLPELVILTNAPTSTDTEKYVLVANDLTRTYPTQHITGDIIIGVPAAPQQ